MFDLGLKIGILKAHKVAILFMLVSQKFNPQAIVLILKAFQKIGSKIMK